MNSLLPPHADPSIDETDSASDQPSDHLDAEDTSPSSLDCLDDDIILPPAPCQSEEGEVRTFYYKYN